MIRLKVCGMREGRNVSSVAEVGVDYMGFIFYRTSPRYVGDGFQLPVIPARVKRVGVFVNETTPQMLEKMTRYQLDFLQLHGQETVEQCKILKDGGARLIKAFAVNDDFNFDDTLPYEAFVDYFLFDTKGKHFGGNGVAFDWKILDRYHQRVPFFLSGGVGPENLGDCADSFKGLNIHAVDINSAVEVAPGMKDIEKITAVKEILKTLKY